MSNFPGTSDAPTTEEAIEQVNEKYLQMVMDVQQNGKKVPARELPSTLVETGDSWHTPDGTIAHLSREEADRINREHLDLMKYSVEGSQSLMQRSRRQSFSFSRVAQAHYSKIFGHD